MGPGQATHLLFEQAPCALWTKDQLTAWYRNGIRCLRDSQGHTLVRRPLRLLAPTTDPHPSPDRLPLHRAAVQRSGTALCSTVAGGQEPDGHTAHDAPEAGLHGNAVPPNLRTRGCAMGVAWTLWAASNNVAAHPFARRQQLLSFGLRVPTLPALPASHEQHTCIQSQNECMCHQSRESPARLHPTFSITCRRI